MLNSTTKPTLYMTLGLPGSGKSTWATREVERNPNTVIVNKDDIRKELAEQGWKWSHENERDVVNVRNGKIVAALREGKSVISSDTNFGKHEKHLRQIAKELGAEFVIVDFTHVPVSDCIDRDEQRTEGKVGAEVIKEMYNKYIAKPDEQHYTPVPNTPLAIICDLDGTLALHNGLRNPYDCAKAAKDKLNKPIFDIIRLFHENGTQIVYLSGREEACRFPTDDFLKTNGCPPGPLFMRATGDHRKDYIVKQELFDNNVRSCYNVRFVLDDRNQVVNMWRKLGLTCLQVADGAF